MRHDPYEPQGPVEWFLFTVYAVSTFLALAAVGIVAAVVLVALLWHLTFG